MTANRLSALFPPPSRGRGRRRRRGSTYLLVIGMAAILTVIGLGALAVARVNTRAVAQAQDWDDAQLLAFSAAEDALACIYKDGNWRTVYNGRTIQKTLSRGTFTWRLADDEDGSLTDEPTDPFSIYVTATVGQSIYSTRTHVTMAPGPLPALKMALCAGDDISLDYGDSLTLIDGPVSANDKLTCNGSIIGDAQARSISIGWWWGWGGGISGSTMTNIDPLDMPDSNVFSRYQSAASTATIGRYTSSLNNVTFSPTSNPLGSTNADGAYYMNTGGRNLTLTNCNVNGTLVVNCAPGTLTISGGTNMVNYRADYPVLIVNGSVSMTFNVDSPSRPWRWGLRGGHWWWNRRYWGWYSFWSRYYTTGSIVGLVHIKRNLSAYNSAGVEGCTIVEGDVTLYGNNRFDNDSTLWENPPKGYTTGGITAKPDSWNRVVP